MATIESKQIWLCPASKKNMIISIENRFEFTNGDNEYAWALSQSFRSKWLKLEIGALCIFGNTKNGFSKAAYVKRKVNLETIENWPFRSPSGQPWTWGFYLTEPFDINLSSQFFIDIGRMAWPTQNMLNSVESQHVKRQLQL
jgi:hypothetical protein